MSQVQRGYFLTVEGVEGVGKTTNIALVERRLLEAGIALQQTREPGGTPLAEALRALLLDVEGESPAEMTELLMVFAARAQHVDVVIEPALASGQWVLCDRFTDATFAYQGGGRGLSIPAIEQLEKLVQQAVRPDLTLLLDAPVAVGMERARGRGELDRFEREDIAFFERVRAAYLQRAAAEPERFRVIDASQPLAQVEAQVHAVIDEVLARWTV